MSFREREQKQWDEQLDDDSGSGKLDFLFEEADKDSGEGLLRDWPRTKMKESAHRVRTYSLDIKPSAQKQLDALDDALFARVDRKILALSDDPRPRGRLPCRLQHR